MKVKTRAVCWPIMPWAHVDKNSPSYKIMLYCGTSKSYMCSLSFFKFDSKLSCVLMTQIRIMK